MSETRWVWLETVDGDHQWVRLEEIREIMKYRGSILYDVTLSDNSVAGNIRAFSVHAAPCEIHPKKLPSEDDTFTVQGA